MRTVCSHVSLCPTADKAELTSRISASLPQLSHSKFMHLMQ
jgi:hypothetical protein